jgi:catechol 2,3-dioxygenase-like lactoylglutathione lyase family enzyme
MKTVGVAHFTIPVSDLTRSVAFYTEVLGLTLIRAGNDLAFLRSGKDHVVLARTDVPLWPSHESGTARNVHQAFIVEPGDFQPSLDHLAERGVEIVEIEERGGTSVFCGRSAYFRDPDGNMLEIIDLASTGFRTR